MRSTRGARRFRFPLLALVIVLAGTIAGAACGARPTTHTVTIEATRFDPAVLTINAGDTVLWINKDMFPHTATAQGPFDSGVIQPANSWQHTFTEPGAIDYICTLHTTMKGRVNIGNAER